MQKDFDNHSLDVITGLIQDSIYKSDFDKFLEDGKSVLEEE